MSKGLAVLASLKAILIAASVAVARGDMLPVVLISILLNLAELGARPAGHANPRDTIVVPRSLDDCRMALSIVWEARVSFRFNKGVPGRGHRHFSPAQIARLRRQLAFYPSLAPMTDVLIPPP